MQKSKLKQLKGVENTNFFIDIQQQVKERGVSMLSNAAFEQEILTFFSSLYTQVPSLEEYLLQFNGQWFQMQKICC